MHEMSMKSWEGTPSTLASWAKIRSHTPHSAQRAGSGCRTFSPDRRHAPDKITPEAAALQCVNNAGEPTAVIDPRHAARIVRQKRFHPSPLLI